MRYLKNLLKINIVVILIFSFNLINPNKIIANTILFDDNFDDNLINSKWSINNYSMEILGSYSNIGQLEIEELNKELRISGSDNIGDIFFSEYGFWVGWFGKSLLTSSTFPIDYSSKYYLETDININDANEGFETHLFIEFNQFNRIVFSIGDNSSGITHGLPVSVLLFEENGKHRGLGSPYDNENPNGWLHLPFDLHKNQSYNLKIQFDPSTKIVKGYIDNKIIHQGTYNGLLSEFKVGIAASVREDEDSIDARFDNFKLSTKILFDLPFNYNNREYITKEEFQNVFNDNLTAAFDHELRRNSFIPYNGLNYYKQQCKKGTYGITCYDSHNGIDFKATNSNEVMSVSTGNVVYTSEHNINECTPNPGGYGCIVIIYYPDVNVYGLYAHLEKIFIDIGDKVNSNTKIGIMGNTGCNQCGKHLHFGVLKLISTYTTKTLNKNDWKELLFLVKPNQSPDYIPYCNYKAPNGLKFSFQDPSGWYGNFSDPMAQSKKEGGCDIESPLLWKYDVYP